MNTILECLTTKEIANLDSAVSSKQCHELFLDCLANLNSKPVVDDMEFGTASYHYCDDWENYYAEYRHCPFSYSRNRNPIRTHGELAWLSRRHVPIRSAVLIGDSVINSTVKLSALHSVTLHDVNDIVVFCTVTSSPGLRSLSMYADSYFENHYWPSFVTGAGIEFGIAANCRNLEHFSYHLGRGGEMKTTPINVDNWLSMFRQCKQLKTVSFLDEGLIGLSDADLGLLREFGHHFDKLHFCFGVADFHFENTS